MSVALQYEWAEIACDGAKYRHVFSSNSAFTVVRTHIYRILLVHGLLTICYFAAPHWETLTLPVRPDRLTLRQRLPPWSALLLLMGLVFIANAPARAVIWEGEMEPLPQYRTYCATYGLRDPGCAAALGGPADGMKGGDYLSGTGRHTLGMAALVHREVVRDLVYRTDDTDVWQILGTPGTGMAGDCDDVVMTTIARLVQRGFPRGALRATIVRLPDSGGYHLILAVRQRRDGVPGELFLDDRQRRPRTASELTAAGYRFIAQEVPGRLHWRRATVRTEPATNLETAG